MPKDVCIACGGEMAFIMREKLQLGEASLWRGTWPNVAAGALEVDIYTCRDCGRLELYRGEGEPEPEPGEDVIARKKCPRCGKLIDMDYVRCPFCRYDYREEE